MTRSLSYIEIDIPFCSLRYGETTGAGTCPAVLGTDSNIKCFNTMKTCAVRESFLEETVTLRYALSTEYLPHEIEAIPSISEITFTPATISLGVDLGQRATLSVTLNDHPHSDTGEGYDKYLADRDYDPFKQGTYWGKFRARQPFLQGRAIRWITGTLGQALADMETRHFIIDSFDGPSPQGAFTLVAKDILKIADGDQSQAPGMSAGFLVAAVTASATSLTLSPSGVGASYPSSGRAAVGGKEIVSFTRSGDVITLTARGLLGTTASAFSAQDRFQLVLSYTAADAADIIYDLMVNYAEIPAAYITLADWKAETAAFLTNLYSADICDPVSVSDLISELILQACLVIWWDEVARKIRLQVLRQLTSSLSLTPQNIIQGSLASAEQPDKRLSQVWVYFGRINPLKSLTEIDNYRSTSVTTDEEAEEDYGVPVIKKIYSRWIPALGRTVADRLGTIQLGRFRDPPRKINFDLARYAGTDVSLGATRLVRATNLQDATGAEVDIPVQITRLNPPADRFSCEAEEIIFLAPAEDGAPQTIIVDADIFNVNLRSAYDAIYPAPESGDTITCQINEGVTVGSTSTSLPAFNVGSWPEAVTILIIINGRILGAGGAGGNNAYGHYVGASVVQDIPATVGLPGGPAFYTRRAVHVQLSGKIGGGGGGGGGQGALIFGGSGGGAGARGGLPGGGQYYSPGSAGTADAGGAAGVGSAPNRVGLAGGNLGQAGASRGFLSGGAAGNAIDGLSYITFDVNTGTIVGSKIN
ncbi:MAG TPA: hypothetical protein VGC26_09725 [Afipia sp.]